MKIGVELHCAAAKGKTTGDTSHNSSKENIFGLLWTPSYLIQTCQSAEQKLMRGTGTRKFLGLQWILVERDILEEWKASICAPNTGSWHCKFDNGFPIVSAICGRFLVPVMIEIVGVRHIAASFSVHQSNIPSGSQYARTELTMGAERLPLGPRKIYLELLCWPDDGSLDVPTVLSLYLKAGRPCHTNELPAK